MLTFEFWMYTDCCCSPRYMIFLKVIATSNWVIPDLYLMYFLLLGMRDMYIYTLTLPSVVLLCHVCIFLIRRALFSRFVQLFSYFAVTPPTQVRRMIVQYTFILCVLKQNHQFIHLHVFETHMYISIIPYNTRKTEYPFLYG